jgi:hypothetical protein
VTLAARVNRVEQQHRCRTCGLSRVALRDTLRATLALIRRSLPTVEAERVIDELRGIWTRE